MQQPLYTVTYKSQMKVSGGGGAISDRFGGGGMLSVKGGKTIKINEEDMAFESSLNMSS